MYVWMEIEACIYLPLRLRPISISLFAHRSATGQVGHVGKKIFTVHSKIYGRRSFPLVYFAAVKKYCSSRSIQQLLRSISPQSRCGGGGGGAASARQGQSRAAGAIYPYSILPRLHPGSLLLISAFGLLRLVLRRRTTVPLAGPNPVSFSDRFRPSPAAPPKLLPRATHLPPPPASPASSRSPPGLNQPESTLPLPAPIRASPGALACHPRPSFGSLLALRTAKSNPS